MNAALWFLGGAAIGACAAIVVMAMVGVRQRKTEALEAIHEVERRARDTVDAFKDRFK